MVEILTHPQDTASEFELNIGEDHEILGDYPWLDWMKKQSGNDRLFAYRHRRTGRTVICAWAWSPKEAVRPIATEIIGFQASPTMWWPEDLPIPEVMLGVLKPAESRLSDRHKAVRAEREREETGRAEDLRHRTSTVKYLRKRGMEDSAHMLDTGAIPWCGPARSPDKGESMKKALMEAARGV